MLQLPGALTGALRELARVRRLLVALDFDGTLAPEVDSPEQARALPAARDAVLRLLALPNTRVALVSGRSLASLIQVADLPDETLLVGSHGIEIRLDHPDDAVSLNTAELEQVDVLHEVLGEVADAIDQVWLEVKPAGFALHTRLATDHNSRVAHLVALSEVQAEVDDVTVREGKNVLEFSVRSTTKGEAVEHLRRYVAADAVFYAGDDVTDEDAFAALLPHDVGVKSGDTLERLARVRAAAFDKTGTLTQGHARVDRCEPAPGFSADTVLALAAAMERTSAHVLAQAIVDEATRRELPAEIVTDVRELTGNGLQGRWDGRPVAIGKPAFVVGLTGEEPTGTLRSGELAVGVAVGDRYAGRIVLRDELRPDAAETVTRLRALGLRRIVMVTGDGGANARRVAGDVGIDEVYAEQTPAGKVSVLNSIRSRPVMMVGDGVNDAPVLAAADVGIALGARGATAASESAEVVLLVDELSRIPAAISIGRRTMGIARQSIFVGVGLSLVVMVIAAFGVIPPIAGALIQEAIDVVTILNGLRAGRRGRKDLP